MNLFSKRIISFIVASIALILTACLFVYIVLHTKTPQPRKFFPPANRYWDKAKETSYKSVPELMAQRKAQLRRGIWQDILMHGSRSKRQIAITFDDGPHPQYTKKILAILNAYDVKATFFLVGEMAERHPDLVKLEFTGGHDIGNHTYHHVNLTKIPVGLIATEIVACDNVLESITHKPIHLFRPPGGDFNDDVTEVCNILNHTVVLWTDDPKDYARPGAERIEHRIFRKVGNGGIILIHDGVQETIDALPYIIQTLKDHGYEFVTINEMLQERNKKL